MRHQINHASRQKGSDPKAERLCKRGDWHLPLFRLLVAWLFFFVHEACFLPFWLVGFFRSSLFP
jgi:hypothetical protein